MNKKTDYEQMRDELLKDPKLKKLYNEHGKQLEVSYQVLQLRKKAKMSQAKLAREIGTTQSNIARMESGRQNFTIGILARIAQAFNKELKVAIS